VLATGYIAKLVSILSVQKVESRVDSLENYLHDKKFKLYVEDEEGLVWHILKDSKNPIQKATWRAIQEGRGGIVPLSEALQHIEEDPYSVFFGSYDNVVAYYNSHCRVEQFYVGKTNYFPSYAGFLVNKKYEHKDLVSNFLYHLLGSGTLPHMRADYLNMSCNSHVEFKGKETQLNNLMDVFMTYLCGILVSCLVFLLELFLFKACKFIKEIAKVHN